MFIAISVLLDRLYTSIFAPPERIEDERVRNGR